MSEPFQLIVLAISDALSVPLVVGLSASFHLIDFTPPVYNVWKFKEHLSLSFLIAVKHLRPTSMPKMTHSFLLHFPLIVRNMMEKS